MIDKVKIQTLIDLPIESVASRLGMEISRHKCLCPFHDDHHASLVFNITNNRFRCYACGEHGNTIDLTMKVLKKNFVEACEWLANENNIILETITAIRTAISIGSVSPSIGLHRIYLTPMQTPSNLR